MKPDGYLLISPTGAYFEVYWDELKVKAFISVPLEDGVTTLADRGWFYRPIIFEFV